MQTPQQKSLENYSKNSLQYLKSTSKKNLNYKRFDHLKIESFIDAYDVGRIMNRCSTSMYYTWVRGIL